MLFKENNIGPNHRNRIRQQAKHRWTSPPAEWYKWNLDASSMESARPTALSYICRYKTGKIIQASSCQLKIVRF